MIRMMCTSAPYSPTEALTLESCGVQQVDSILSSPKCQLDKMRSHPVTEAIGEHVEADVSATTTDDHPRPFANRKSLFRRTTNPPFRRP